MTRNTCLAICTCVGLFVLVVGSCTKPATHSPRRQRGVTPTLLAQLGEAHWQRRAEAARRLGATRHADAVAPLTRAMADADERVRLAVVKACGVHRSPGLIPALKKALEAKSRKLRRQAVRALAAVDTRAAAEAMLETLDGASLWLRPAVADALATMSSSALTGIEVAVEVLLAELSLKQPKRFRRLALALANVGELALDRLLREMLKPPPGPRGYRYTDKQCRRKACRALVAAGKRALPGLVRLCQYGGQDLSRHSVCEVLLPVVFSRLGKLVTPFLLAHHGKASHLGSLASFTVNLLGEKGVGVIIDRLDKPGQPDGRRIKILRLIGRIRHPRAFAILAGQARRGKKALRLAAIAALGDLRSAPAKKLLLTLKGDPDKGVAKAAAKALLPLQPKTTIGTIGIAECDAYIRAMRCYIGKLPAAARAATLVAFQKTVETYRKMTGGPAKSMLAKACRMTLAALKKGVAKMPGFRDCFPP